MSELDSSLESHEEIKTNTYICEDKKNGDNYPSRPAHIIKEGIHMVFGWNIFNCHHHNIIPA